MKSALLILVLSFTANALYGQFLFSLNSDDGEVANNVAVDAQGNSFIVGIFGETLDVDPSENVVELTNQTIGNATTVSDILVASYDPSGDLRFAFNLPVQALAYNAGRGLAIDSEGNVYVTGQLTGIADMDPSAGVFTIGSVDSQNSMFLASYTNNGQFRFALEIKNTGAPGVLGDFDIEIDDNDNLYISGLFLGTVDFNPGSGVNLLEADGVYQTFLVSFTDSGDFRFARNMGFEAIVLGAVPDFKVTGNGDIFFVGQFGGSIDLDPGPGTFTITPTSGIYGAFVARYDSNGDFVSGFLFANKTFARLLITLDPNNNIYLAGFFVSGTVDFDPGFGNFEIYSYLTASFLVSYTQDGDFRFGFDLDVEPNNGQDVNQSLPYDLKSDYLGNIYISGSLQGTVDFDRGPAVFTLGTINLDDKDMYVASYSPEGDFRFASKVGTPGREEADDYRVAPKIAIGNNLKTYMTGAVDGGIEFNYFTGEYVMGIDATFTSSAIFLACFSQTGELGDRYPTICTTTTETINDNTIADNTVVVASNWIEASGAIEIGSNVYLQAQSFISLQPGFHAKSGSQLKIRVSSCSNNNAAREIPSRPATVFEEPLSSAKTETFSIYPNPASGQFSVRYTLAEPQKMSMGLRSIDGKIFQRWMQEEWRESGEWDFRIDANRLPAGIYALYFKTEKELVYKKLVISR